MAFGKGAGIAKSTNYVLSWGSPFMSTARSGRKQFATRKPKSKTQNPKPEIQNPKSKTQHQNSKNQNPKSKNLNAKRPLRARNPTTFKASRPLPAAGGSGRQLATSTLNQILQTASGSGGPKPKACYFDVYGVPPSCQRLAVAGSESPRRKFNPEPFATQKPKSKARKPKSKTQNPTSKTQNQNQKSKTQHPK